jgi:protoheme IX farnesyltransferase
LGGALTAGGASAVNHFIDRESDGQMQRTRNRPLPAGRLSPVSVLTFGLVLGILGVAVYAVFVNLLSALLAGFGYLYYVIFYSIYLKRSTPHNIVVGGGAGAVPPLVGWAAATGQLSMAAFFLFAFVFFWTPPHFWALALLKRRDYARAGVPMLPVVVGGEATRRQILLYSLQLVALSIILPLADLGGWLFLAMAIPSGIALLAYAWRLWRKGGNRIAWKMYRYSSTYLAVIFAALVFDTFI